MLERGRTCFGILAGGLIALLAATLGRLPPVVASHFDFSGAPNGWSSRPAYAILLVVIGAGLPAAMVGLVTWLTRGGPDRLNLPAREYWTRPEHRGQAVRLVRHYIWWLACILAGTAMAMHLLVLSAHATRPPRLGTEAVLAVIAAVLLAIAAWTVGWYRLLRRPEAR